MQSGPNRLALDAESGRFLIVQEGPAPVLHAARPGAVWPRQDGSVCGRAFVTPAGRWLAWDDLGLIHLDTPGGVTLWPHKATFSQDIDSRVLHELRPILLQALGWEAMHASAVLGPAGAVLFCGQSGAGKSTLAYAVARSGWPQLADDHLVLRFEGEVARVNPLPFQPSLRAATAAHFATPETMDESSTLLPDAVPPALIVLVVQDAAWPEPYSISRVAPTAAFTALLPHAHCFDPYDPTETSRLVAHYLCLVNDTPVWQLTYRPSFSHLEAMVKAIRALTVNDQEERPA